VQVSAPSHTLGEPSPALTQGLSAPVTTRDRQGAAGETPVPGDGRQTSLLEEPGSSHVWASPEGGQGATGVPAERSEGWSGASAQGASWPPVCNCRIRVVNRDGEQFTVKSRRWDCPSCGLDKAERIRDLCVSQKADRMWVLTFSQPTYEEGAPPPERHTLCSPDSHLYEYSDGTQRWRMLESCPHCCRASARALANFRKALRRRWAGAEMLWVREIKPRSGAFDINLVITGVPPMSRKTVAGRRVKALWVEAGGGFLDLGDGYKGRRSAGGVGRYIGKYLTKFAARPLARGFRRWSRSAGFAAGVLMAEKREPSTQGRMAWLGWVDPDDLEVMPHGLRWWPPPP